jgi:iron complex outermembrane receptor protein|tara:strand:- start:824 stop:2767 length:1944 start_codon:yes stop_codon:yes gene_type:complete
MPNTFLKYLIIVPTSLLLALNTQSQSVYDTLLLSELEVIGNLDDLNSTTKVTTIDSIKRNELNLQDIGELLAAFTPVFVKSYGRGTLSTVSFRGTGASHTKVLWEGFNINSPMLGQTDFSLLPNSFFNEVELNYGGGSLIEISGALGGSVSLKSKIDQTNSIFSIHQSIGSFNTYLTSAVLNLKKERISSSTHFVRQSSVNDFQYYNNALLPVGKEMIQTDADFVVNGFTQQLAYKISGKQQIKFITWNQWNNRTIPKIMTNVEKGGNHREWQKDFSSRNILQWELNTSKTQWEAKAAYFYEELDYYLQTSDSLIDSKNLVESYSFIGNVSTELVNTFILKAGIELLRENVISNNYIEKKQRHKISSYVSLKKTFKKKFTAEALVRAEVSDSEFIPLMPMIGINYKPFARHDLHIRANVSRNYNLPSLNDLYWYPNGNEDLKPEQSLQTEAGLDYSLKLNNKNLLTVSGSAYISSVNNWIIWEPGDYIDWHPENIPKVLSRGAELSCQIKGKYRNILYSFFGEYAVTRTTRNSDSAKISGLSNIQLIYVPMHTANGFLNISTRGYYVNWSLSFTSSRNTSLNKDKNSPFILPSYMLNNISVGKKFMLKKAGFDIRFKIYNVFNVDYQAVLWRAMPGRNFEISLNCKI